MSNMLIPELDAKGLRSFGLTTGAIVVVIFGLGFPFLFDFSIPVWPYILAGVLWVWALVLPATLNPVYKGWMRFGLLLSRITTPIILTLVFAIAILPAAIIMKIIRRDAMHRSYSTETESYRIASTKPVVKNLDKPY